MSALNELESAVLDQLLAGEHPALEVLRVQREQLVVSKREFTGVGFFTEFSHPPEVVRLVRTSEYFGSGGQADQLLVVSHALAQAIDDAGIRGAYFQPVASET